MKNKNVRYIIWGIIVLLYMLIISFFVIRLSTLYNGYLGLEKEKISVVQIELQNIFEHKEGDDLTDALDDLIEEQSMELIVYDESKRIYSTFGELDIISLNQIFHESASLYKFQGPLKTEKGTYTLLYNIYPVHDSKFVQLQLKQLTLLLLGLVLLVGAVITYITLTLIHPLDKLKQALHNLNTGKADIGTAIHEKNVIDRALNQFTKTIDNKFSSVSREYTDLEISLQFERERIAVLLTMARAYIHDFKTPVHQTLLENEILYKENKSNNVVVKEITSYNVRRNDRLLRQINDVLILMDTDASELLDSVEHIDLMAILDEILHIFKINLKERNLGFYSDAPEEVWVNMNIVSVKIILHNLFSNAVKYALENTEICFEIDEDDSYIRVRCMNEASRDNIRRMHNSENLFNIVDNAKDYSSGNGLYILKELSEHLGGTYQFTAEENRVVIEVILPKGKDDVI